MELEKTSVRLWKRLEREERLAAAQAFWAEPARDLLLRAVESVAKARRMRPQAVRSMSEDERARALAGILDPGEPLAAGLLVSLHLAQRRPLLAAFLDALKLPHEDGVLGEETEPAAAITLEELTRAAAALSPAHPAPQVAVYLNTLWLQDPERWAALAELEPPGPAASS